MMSMVIMMMSDAIYEYKESESDHPHARSCNQEELAVVQDASARQAEADNDHHDNVAAVDAT